jgi:hypothetical protein
VALELCFPGSAELERFQDRYGAWRRALRAGDEYERVATSRRLQELLQGWGEAEAGGAATGGA